MQSLGYLVNDRKTSIRSITHINLREQRGKGDFNQGRYNERKISNNNVADENNSPGVKQKPAISSYNERQGGGLNVHD
jgi:hypothetical protein